MEGWSGAYERRRVGGDQRIAAGLALLSISRFNDSADDNGREISLALMGAVLGLVLLAAAVSDVIDRLVLERDLDSLTETLNRREFERVAGRRIADKKSYPFALVVFDIDNFKSIRVSSATGRTMVGVGAVCMFICEPQYSSCQPHRAHGSGRIFSWIAAMFRATQLHE